MPTIAEALALALATHQAGDLPRAEQMYRQILAAAPQLADAWHLLGVVEHQSGQHSAALERISHAIALNPTDAVFHSNLGLVYQALDRPDKALASLQEAIRLQPNYVDALNNVAAAMNTRNRPAEAIGYAERALRLQPSYAQAHYNLGVALGLQGKWDESIQAYLQAIELQPGMAAAYNNLGNAVREQGNTAEAIAYLQRAAQLDPNRAEILNNLGLALLHAGRLDEAVASLQQAVRLQPDLAQAHNNLANVYREKLMGSEAIAGYQKAIECQPTFFEAYNNLGATLLQCGRLDDAVGCLRQAVRLQPDFAPAHCNLGTVLKEQMRLEEALDCFRRALELDPQCVEAHSSYLYSLTMSCAIDADSLFAEHRKWGQMHAPLPAHVSPHANSRDRDRPLRIGYVSPDFRKHPVAMFIEPVLRHHDRARYETILYAEVPAPDEVSDRLRELAAGWRNTCGLSSTAMAQLIREDGIDILVELAGHTHRTRLLTLALKPAPVQVTYLGYPNTSGVPAIDYRITDAVADPPGEPRRHTEELIRLPNSFCCFTPPLSAPDVSPLPALTKGRVTFGSMHNLAKVNAKVLDLWSQLLTGLPDSRLLIIRDTLHGSMADFIRDEFARRGLSSDRVELRHQLPGGKHLPLYDEIDVALDVLPWSGHTTSCESLWMGVPMLTLYGDRHAGRLVSSVMSAVGLQDWIARTPAEFVEIAVKQTRDLDRLAQLRRGLREQMVRSPLCDGAAFARDLESLYRQMWQRWCAS
jgi:protein O-GlcNAc transferase